MACSNSLGRLSNPDKGWGGWLTEPLSLEMPGLLLPGDLARLGSSAAREAISDESGQETRATVIRRLLRSLSFVLLPTIPCENIPFGFASGNDVYDGTLLHRYDKIGDLRHLAGESR